MISLFDILKLGGSDSIREEVYERVYWHELSNALTINIMPTLRCNLRCEHCNIKHMLVDEEDSESLFSKQDILSFLARMIEAYPSKRIHTLFIGGEVFVDEERLRDLIHAVYPLTQSMSMTTNLSALPKDLSFLKLIDDYQVSLDGLPEDHDKQRNSSGLFQKVYQNLGVMKNLGIINRVSIAGCSYVNDGKITSAYMKKFKAMLMMLGIDARKINIGSYNPPSKDYNIKEGFAKFKEAPACMFNGPCCSWRFMQNMCVTPNGKVWTHYYGVNQKQHLLGTLKSSIDEIRSNSIKAIQHAPFMTDETCKSCKALSRCWGLHCYARWMFETDPKPSQYCNQKHAIEIHDDLESRWTVIYPLVNGVTTSP